MNLQKIINSLHLFNNDDTINNINITSIENDHRNVTQGSLFICIKGYTVDGHDFAESAVSNGAAAIISERPLQVNVPVIVVPNSTRAMAIVADTFYKQPSQSLKMIGITGTNGKTTTTHLIEQIFNDAGNNTGLIGTIYSKIGNKTISAKNTTPESLSLQKILSKMVEEKVETVVMEVSSHALQLGRVHGVDFQIALFTNLSQDHLDFHKSMEEYAQAKGLLFSQLGNSYDAMKPKFAIINNDDTYAEKFKITTAAHLFSYGITNKSDVMATGIAISAKGTRFKLVTPVGSKEVSIKLAGKFNVYNVLAAVSVGLVSKIPLDKIIETIEKIEGVAGRFQLVDGSQPYTVIVDYAHTPDGLENVLLTVKEFSKGRVFVVVGCGGDRDKTKRPLMAQIACKYGTDAVFTSDNPRSEDPQAILNDMEKGVDGKNFISIIDRKEAIKYAIENAAADDVILIAGKGHETTQTIGKDVLEFDDRLVALDAIKKHLKK